MSERFIFNPDHIQQLRDDYPTLGAVALAERFGCSPRTIRYKASKLKIRNTTIQAINGRIRAAKNRSCRLDFFDTWTPESAYVLGYIWADGSIHQEHGKPAGLEFICTEDDAQILRDIARVLECTNSLRSHAARDWVQSHGNYAGRTYHSRAAVRLAIHSTFLADKLVHEHGIPVRKSSVDPPFPTNIPDAMLHHFARGNFDGDGSVGLRKRGSRSSVYFLGTTRFMTDFVPRITSQAGVYPPSVCRQGAKLIRAIWTAKPDCLRLFDWLYKDSTIHLNRKRAKFEEVATALASVKDYARRKRIKADSSN